MASGSWGKARPRRTAAGGADEDTSAAALRAIADIARSEAGPTALQRIAELLGRSGVTPAAADFERLQAENNRLRQVLLDRTEFVSIVGSSDVMCEVRAQVAAAAAGSMPLLILGARGTGRSLIARAVHTHSPRRGHPFVQIACAAVPAAPSDGLFGDGPGGGTVFLDEVGDLSMPLQLRLLAGLGPAARAADSAVDVRVVACSSENLEDACAEGTIARDLIAWIGAMTIRLPRLEERKTDLPALVDHFVNRSAHEHARQVRGVSSRAMELLAAYHWPGNLQELSVAIDRAVALASGPLIHDHDLPAAVREAGPPQATLGLAEALAGYERELLKEALVRAHGVKSQAARLLKTTDRIFNYKLRRHGIDGAAFKATEPRGEATGLPGQTIP